MTYNTEGWRKNMRDKYNVDDEGLSEIMRQRQQKSMLNPNRQKGRHKGGFNYMTPEERSEMGRKAARARWKNQSSQ